MVASVNSGAGPIFASRPPSFALWATASVDTVAAARVTRATTIARLRTIYPFSSFLSPPMNRQSVPRALMLCGLLLTIPSSWRRRE